MTALDGDTEGADNAGPPSPPSTGRNGYARESTPIRAQFGLVHRDVRVEYRTRGESAEEQFTVGLNNLRAGAPREAEKLIRAAYTRGLATNEVRFYYALALVSGRSIKHVVQDGFTELDATFAAVDPHSEDQFYQGLLTVRALIGWVIEQDLQGSRTGDQLSAVLQQFDALPVTLREEIGRHLDLVLVGAVEDELDARESSEIEQRRHANDRNRRVRTFFIPDPTEPRRRPLKAPTLTPAERLPLLGSAALVVLGVVFLFTAVIQSGSRVAWLLFLIDVVAAVVVVLGVSEVVAARQWRLWVDQPRDENPEDRWAAPPQEDRDRFAAFLADSYGQAFHSVAPEGAAATARWTAQTTDRQRTLLAETVETYGDDATRHPENLNWLVYHRARRTRQQWEQGELEQRRLAHQPRRERLIALSGGAAVLVIGGVLLIGTLFSATLGPTFLGLLLTGLGTHLTVHLGLARFAAWRCHPWIQAEADRNYDEDHQAYLAEVEFLRDRPTDLEMAAWLAYDTRFIKNEALKEYGLNHRDIVSHLVLTEAGAECRRARVPGGPARYSEYVVRLFLLTENGVRQFVITLNFVSGELSNHRRLGFSYEKLASATVKEVGEPAEGAALSHAFRLTLVNQEHTDVLIENYELWTVRVEGEDKARFLAQAMETSGVTTALRILEAVAVEGRDWIRQERNRYLRTLRRYAERSAPMPGVRDGPTIAALLARDSGPGDTGIPGRQRISLDVYLDTADTAVADRVLAVVDDVARQAGLTGLIHGDVTYHPCTRRSSAVMDDDAATSVRRQLQLLGSAFSEQHFARHSARSDRWVTDAINDLTTALRPVPRACLRFEQLLLVKYRDAEGALLRVALMGSDDQAWLVRFPDMGHHPERILRALAAHGPAITASDQDDNPVD